MSARAAMAGSSPEVKVSEDADMAARLKEREKYERMWAHSQYREVAPGETTAFLFMDIAKPALGAEVIDFGAGTGRGALMLAIRGCKVHMLDFADNCLDQDVKDALSTQSHVLQFSLHDLNRKPSITSQYGYCTDVMEHIPPENVDRVLKNILRASQHVFFQIACEDDVCGRLIGEPLHLSVHPYAWWLEKLQELGAVVHWSQDYVSHCAFYVSAWISGDDVTKAGKVNCADEQIISNVRANIAGDWRQVEPELNEGEVIILGGGPSLNDRVEEIRALRSNGALLVCLNASYQWALDNGLKPSAQIMVDAREFNARFTRNPVEGCKYFMASQVHPSVLEGLPKDRTFLWHTSAEMIREDLSKRYETWYGIPGGCTVLTRSLPLLRMIGYSKFHLFGVDSCLIEDKHHAYDQPENDSKNVIPVIVGGKTFKCHPWMIAQAQDFINLIKVMGDEIELNVPGDGLLAHIINTGASLAPLEN